MKRGTIGHFPIAGLGIGLALEQAAAAAAKREAEMPEPDPAAAPPELPILTRAERRRQARDNQRPRLRPVIPKGQRP